MGAPALPRAANPEREPRGIKMTRHVHRVLPALLLLSAVLAHAEPAELLYLNEGNRLRVFDIASLDAGQPRETILVERASLEPKQGRDINGTVCPLPDGSGRFVAGEDTGQPSPPPGWGIFDRRGAQVGKMSPTVYAEQAEPYGCAVDPDGRLFTVELGDPGFREANGQLLLWFPPFAGYPGEPGRYPGTDATSHNYCKLATDIGTATGIAIDRAGRVYVSSSSAMEILRFSPPFPTGPDASGGCGRQDALGSPMADRIQRDVFAGPQWRAGLLTYTGLAIAPNGNLYAASIVTGRIGELDLDGRWVRNVLTPEEWLPPFRTGTPQGIAVDGRGRIYYADMDLDREGLWLGPGADGKLWRIAFDARGEPLAPELIRSGLAFPDGVSVLAAAEEDETWWQARLQPAPVEPSPGPDDTASE
jgi:hypothetical protein